MPEFTVTPNTAKLLLAGVTITDLVNSIDATNLLDSPGLYEADHQLVLGLVGAQVHSAEELGQIVVKNSSAGVPIKIADVADVEHGVAARLHHGSRQRQTRRPDQHRPPALQQHRPGRRRSRRRGRSASKPTCLPAFTSNRSTISRNWSATASPASATPSSSASSSPPSSSSSSSATGAPRSSPGSSSPSPYWSPSSSSISPTRASI